MAEAHFEQLLAELGERASAELAQVQTDGERLSVQVLADADARVMQRRNEALAACESEYARRRAGAAADARHAARGNLLRAQHALVATVIARARAIVAERLGREGETPAIAARVSELSSYAAGGTVTRGDGLSLVANEGRIVIDDSIDAWLDGERAQIAIDVCRAVEAA